MILEPRDKLAGADQQRHILAGAAVERRAVDRALERNRDPISLFRRFGLGDERPVLLGDRL